MAACVLGIRLAIEAKNYAWSVLFGWFTLLLKNVYGFLRVLCGCLIHTLTDMFALLHQGVF